MASPPRRQPERPFLLFGHEPRVAARGHPHEDARRRDRRPFENDAHDEGLGRLGDGDAPEDALGAVRGRERARLGDRLVVALPPVLSPVAVLGVATTRAPEEWDHASSSAARSAMILSCTWRGMAS